MSRHTRKIRQRWLIEGRLVLLTPTHLSNGDTAFDVDMPLLLDPLEERPLLTGASIAGALRNYVNEYLNDYEYRKDRRSEKRLWVEKTNSQAAPLFGAARRDDEGEQSPLIVNDALGKTPSAQTIELRDGVRIDPQSRTAAAGAKYDLQLLPAGTTFDISFELIVTENADEALLRQTLALALHGLQEGQIYLGGRKRRGFGECQVTSWKVWRYDLTKPSDLKAWLVHGRENISPSDQRSSDTGSDIRLLLGSPVILQEDKRDQFTITANFDIDGSVLIRAGFEADYAPDVTHLESRRHGEMTPVLSGTSLAGVIRSQAFRIAHTLSHDEGKATQFIRELFGYMPPTEKEDDGFKATSRVLVKETEITGDYKKLVQSRVAIDRFTGGALESALFTEQPVYGGQAQVTLSVRPPLLTSEDEETVVQQWQAEKGLLLLVLKDLWTGFLPIGGEASVGRGRLKGVSGKIVAGKDHWQLNANTQPFISGNDPTELEKYVEALVTLMTGGGA